MIPLISVVSFSFSFVLLLVFVWLVCLFVCFALCMHVLWVNVNTGDLSMPVYCMVLPVTKHKEVNKAMTLVKRVLKQQRLHFITSLMCTNL